MSKNKQVVTFGLSAKQYKAFSDWKNSLPPLDVIPAAGGAYCFKFVPTGLATHVEIERIDGKKISIKEDYDSF